MDHLIKPHGGRLVNLIVEDERAKDLKKESKNWISWNLTPRQLFDLELLINGGFSPLTGYMKKQDYDNVCNSMLLSDRETVWPIPVVLDVSAEIARKVKPGDKIALRDPEGVMLAVQNVEEIWEPNKFNEAEIVYGTKSKEHHGVKHLLYNMNQFYIGGKVEGIQLPDHFDFKAVRYTPNELRFNFGKRGWRNVIAFQTRNPMHLAHYNLTMRAVKDIKINLLIHPVVGLTKPGDVDYYTRVRCYQALLKHYPENTAMLSLLPLAMRMAGPKEALFHALIRKNFGCTHLIVGRDHAGPGLDSKGDPFYGPYDAQELFKKYEDKIGVKMVPFRMMVYVEDMDKYLPVDEVPEGMKILSISGTELRKRLEEGRRIPEWFTFKEITEELRRTYPPRNKQGFTIFFTGLPSSGKSTLAKALLADLLQRGGRKITLLDGDLVRKNLSSELGFSKEHRDINIRRIGFVASEITKNGGIAICAPIAPYDSIRKEVKEFILPVGGFVLVHVATPLEVCEERDRKGLYAKAREGIIKEFTGISDPYEPPDDAGVTIDTTDLSPEEGVQQVILHLEKQGYIAGE